MPGNYVHKFASWLLNSALSISPSHVRPWGAAMLAELKHIKAGGAALSWAVGGSGVLVRRALLSLFTKSNRGKTVLLEPSLLLREGTMRRITTLLASLSVAAFLLFLLAPTFRQAMGTSLGIWRGEFDSGASYDRALKRLAAEARKNHDAEAMVFVALRLWDDPESSRLAEEAVRLDSRLTWIYSILGNPYQNPRDAEERIRELEAWDPRNAFTYLVEADRIFSRHFEEHNYQNGGFAVVKDDPRWFEVMSAAFQADKYDSYLARRLDLDRSVMRRYHLHEPLLLLSDAGPWLFGMGRNEWIYAEYLFDLGRSFEAKGDLKLASQKYSSVARFCQMARLQPSTDIERVFLEKPQIEAYQRLRSLAEKKGNLTERDLLTYEIQQVEREKSLRLAGAPGPLSGVYRGGSALPILLLWNGEMVQLFSLLVLLSGGLILAWAVSKVTSRRFRHLIASHWSSFISAAGLVGAIALASGAGGLYLSYRPYAQFFSYFMTSTGAGQLHDYLTVFYALRMAPLSLFPFLQSPFLRVYAWYAFIALATVALALVLMRAFRKRPQLHAAA